MHIILNFAQPVGHLSMRVTSMRSIAVVYSEVAFAVACLLHRLLKGGLLKYHSSTNTIAQTTSTNPRAMSQPQILVFVLFLLFRSIHVSL